MREITPNRESHTSQIRPPIMDIADDIVEEGLLPRATLAHPFAVNLKKGYGKEVR